MAKRISVDSVAERYYGDVYKFCCARCRDAAAAQDITQETFLVLVEKKDELTDKNILSWLFTVADNKLHEWFRENSVESGFVSIYDLEDRVAVDLGFEDTAEPLPDLDAVQQRILDILTEPEKQLFIKCYVEKRSVSLIREELGISDAALRSRKSRLKKKVAAAVKDMNFIFLVLAFKLFHHIP